MTQVSRLSLKATRGLKAQSSESETLRALVLNLGAHAQRGLQ